MRSWPPKPILMLVLGDEVQEAGELIALAPEVGVQQGVVAFATAPQHVVLPAEPLGDLEHVLDLCRGEREHLWIGVRGRASLVARVGEQVRRSPQQSDAGPFLVPGGIVGQGIEVRAKGRERVALGRHVAIVEAVVGRAELREELECDGHLPTCRLHLVTRLAEPWPVERPHPEHVDPGPGERVPETDAGPEVVLHPLPEDEAVGLIDLEGEWIGRSESLESDGRGHVDEEWFSHARCLLLLRPSSIHAGPVRALDSPSAMYHPVFVRVKYKRPTGAAGARSRCPV